MGHSNSKVYTVKHHKTQTYRRQENATEKTNELVSLDGRQLYVAYVNITTVYFPDEARYKHTKHNCSRQSLNSESGGSNTGSSSEDVTVIEKKRSHRSSGLRKKLRLTKNNHRCRNLSIQTDEWLHNKSTGTSNAVLLKSERDPYIRSKLRQSGMKEKGKIYPSNEDIDAEDYFPQDRQQTKSKSHKQGAKRKKTITFNRKVSLVCFNETDSTNSEVSTKYFQSSIYRQKMERLANSILESRRTTNTSKYNSYNK